MADFRKWSDLAKGEREQVVLMLLSLKEFSYGFDRATEIGLFADEASAMSRFYTNSLYHYCAAYFTVGGALKLRNIVSEIGSSDLLGPVEEILNSRLGDTTFQDILDAYRDKFLVHQSFRMAPLKKQISKKFD